MNESWLENKALLLDIVKDSVITNPRFIDYKDDILLFTEKYIDQVKSKRFSFKNTELMNRSILQEVHQYMNYIHKENTNPITASKTSIQSNAHIEIQPVGYEFNEDVSNVHFEKQRMTNLQQSYETKQKEREFMLKKNIPSKIDFTDPINERNVIISKEEMETKIQEVMKKRELMSYIKEDVKSEISNGTASFIHPPASETTNNPSIHTNSNHVTQTRSVASSQTICPVDSIDEYYNELNYTKSFARTDGNGIEDDNLNINIHSVQQNTKKTLHESSLSSKQRLEPIVEEDESNENIHNTEYHHERDTPRDLIKQSIREDEYSIPRSYSMSNNEGGYMEWSRSTMDVYDQHTNRMTLNIESDELVEIHHLVFIYHENASHRDSNNEYIKIYTTISEGETRRLKTGNELNLFIKDTLCKNIERFTGMYYIHQSDTNLSSKKDREVKSVILEFPYALQLEDIKDVFVQGVIR